MRHLRSFTTTALRLAESWSVFDVGRTTVYDSENGRYYYVVAAGAGASTMVPFAEQFGYITLPLVSFREVDSSSDVGNIVANGGVLASDTTPIYRGDAAEMQEIAWAASNSDPIATSVVLPADFDGSRDVTVMLRTASGGTTNAATFTVETGWDGAALVSDTATGAAATAFAAANATVAAADVADSSYSATIVLTPAAHTTDTMLLRSCMLKYYRK